MISEILDPGYEWCPHREEDKPTLSCEYLGTVLSVLGALGESLNLEVIQYIRHYALSAHPAVLHELVVIV